MKLDLTSIRSQAIVIVIGTVFMAWVVFGFVDLIQTQRTRQVFEAIGNANEVRIKKGESIESAEVYIAALRAIDLDYTKKDLRSAFEAYLSGFEEGIAALKAGKDPAAANEKSLAAHHQLVEIAKRYE